MVPKRHSPTQTETITEITGKDTMSTLDAIKSEILQLNKKIEDISSRLDIITDLLLSEEKSELVGYLQETLDLIKTLDDENKGVPISRIDLANVLDVHPNTAYVRAEKLVKKHMLFKFYGRELALTRFEEKKAVYYSLPRTLYDPKYLDLLKNENEAAHRISITLLQQQPLSKNILLTSKKLSVLEIETALQYLLNRGLIIQETKKNVTQYRIRSVETEN